MKARYLSLNPFILWRKAEHPIDWAARFGRQARLDVEIGFGSGEYLVRAAQANPERNFVGIELEWASVLRGLRRIAQADVRNVRLVLTDARVGLNRLFAPRSIAAVQALFPCPWPKERHVKHRLFSREFLALLNNRLADGGLARIVTDHRPYVTWVEEQVPGTALAATWQAVPAQFNTKYERKWRTGGQEQFYDICLSKQTHLDVPQEKEAPPMETHRVKRFDPERFKPRGIREEVAVEYKDYLFDAKRQRGMTRVIVAEQELLQDFWIEIVKTASAWHIRPAHGCQIVPTLGVQRALDLVRDAAERR